MEYQLKVVMCDLGPPRLSSEAVVKLFGTILCYCQCDQSKKICKACLGHIFQDYIKYQHHLFSDRLSILLVPTNGEEISMKPGRQLQSGRRGKPTFGEGAQFWGHTWRINPFSKWLGSRRFKSQEKAIWKGNNPFGLTNNGY